MLLICCYDATNNTVGVTPLFSEALRLRLKLSTKPHPKKLTFEKKRKDSRNPMAYIGIPFSVFMPKAARCANNTAGVAPLFSEALRLRLKLSYETSPEKTNV